MDKKDHKYQPGWRDRGDERNNALKSSRYVGILKVFLPIIAAVGLIAIILWPKIQSLINVDDPATRKIHSFIKSQPKIKNTAVNPEFISTDKKGRPYVMRAKTAVHNDADTMDLSYPTGEFKVEDGDSIKFSANVGRYIKSKTQLNLTGQVHVTTDKGYDLYTKSAQLDLKTNSGEGNDPIHGTGPIGENISAEGFHITDKGDKVTFKGKTKITMPSEGT